MGTAMSITALPILGRMMMELNITRTRIGAVTISAAASDDAAGWTILAAVSALVAGGFQWTLTLRMIAEIAAFALTMHLLVRPVLCRWVRWALRRSGGEIGPGSPRRAAGPGVRLCDRDQPDRDLRDLRGL